MANNNQPEIRELRDYVTAFRRRWPWVFLPLIAIPALMVYWTTSQPIVYESTAEVLIDDTAAQEALAGRNFINTTTRTRELANEINLAKGDKAEELVRQQLSLAPTDDLPIGSISSADDADVLIFTFTGATAAEAAFTANTWAGVYIEIKQQEAEASIQQALDRLQANQDDLRAQRNQVRANLENLEDRLVTTQDPNTQASLQLQINREQSAISGDVTQIDAQIAANATTISALELSAELAAVGTVRVISNGVEAPNPTNAPLSRNVAVGIVIGLVVGMGLALLVESLDRTIKDDEDVQRLDLTVLGLVPRAPRSQARSGLATIAQTQPGSPVADGFQKVRTALQFATLGRDVKTIVVTSPKQGDGKTTTAANLALAFANVESRVVLADIDFRRPKIHKIFNTEQVPGITDALVGQITLRQMAVSHPELSTTLVAMPAGTQPPNPATFVASSMFASLLTELRSQADLTILDAPPVLPVADALSVAAHADGVVLVVRAGETTQEELTTAVESIDRSGGQLLGIVINHAQAKSTSYRYGEISTTPLPQNSRPLGGPAGNFGSGGGGRSQQPPASSGQGGPQAQASYQAAPGNGNGGTNGNGAASPAAWDPPRGERNTP